PQPFDVSLVVATQVFPLQHPVHPDDVLHTHAPELQVRPVPHGEHAAPPVPQLVFDSLATATQVFPLQHPAHPDDALHTHAPPLHVVPVPHGLHIAPFTPHVALLDVWHLPDESQQPEHDVESQTHVPLVVPLVLQCCPCAHGPHEAPPVPQLPAVSLA